MKALRIVLQVVMVSVAPVVHYFCYFQAGREGKPLGFNMVGTDLCFLLIAPIIVGLAVALIVPVKGRLRLAYGFTALLVTPILVFFVPPAPVVSYTHGFERAIETEVGLATLQQWAEETLAKFHQGRCRPPMRHHIGAQAMWCC